MQIEYMLFLTKKVRFAARETRLLFHVHLADTICSDLAESVQGPARRHGVSPLFAEFNDDDSPFYPYKKPT